MRPLKCDERGATALIVGVLLVSLFGFGALTIDVGALVQERRVLQNGADAAALAVAEGCALGVTCGSATATADGYANLNADDGDSDIREVCGTGTGLAGCSSAPSVPSGTKYVKLTTSTREVETGGPQITYRLGQLLTGTSGTTVSASAVAAWGPIASATTVPLAFSKCEYDQYVAARPLQDGPPFTGPRSVIAFHSSTDCAAPPSGFDLPGGFGWLKDPNGDCHVRINANALADENPGNSITGTGCTASDWQLKKVLIPIFDYTNGLGGSNGKYHIIGFASLYVTGYHFVGGGGGTWGGACSPPVTCIAGYLNRFIAVGEPFGTPAADFGSVIVKLVG